MSNAYTYQPPCTAEELRRLYCDEGMSQTEIAVRLGTTQKVIWRAMHKAQIPTRRAAKRDQRGPRNSSWKGGRVLQAKRATRAPYTSGGYWYIRDPDHPHANKSGYVAEHVKVALAATGRERLTSNEVVHHVNLNKDDNRPENLVIVDRGTHATWHAQLALVAVSLMSKGLVGFDPSVGYFARGGDAICPSAS